MKRSVFQITWCQSYKNTFFFVTDEGATRGARKLTGVNLKVVSAEFSTLSLAVLQNVYNLLPIQTRLRLDLKTQSTFRPVSLSLFMG